ncbi:MAG TPA: hypothetical protein VHC49_12570 [Mycobacteriales bacterium]|nr:hypothetical protein [Mycobacteriales bacterium]
MQALPGARRATIDPPKLAGYTLNPDHPGNNGKAEGWREMGYEVDTPEGRSRSAAKIEPLIRQSAVLTSAEFERKDDYGRFYRTWLITRGPNCRLGRLVCSWQIDNSGTTRLVTTLVQPFKEGKNDR